MEAGTTTSSATPASASSRLKRVAIPCRGRGLAPAGIRLLTCETGKCSMRLPAWKISVCISRRTVSLFRVKRSTRLSCNFHERFWLMPERSWASATAARCPVFWKAHKSRWTNTLHPAKHRWTSLQFRRIYQIYILWCLCSQVLASSTGRFSRTSGSASSMPLTTMPVPARPTGKTSVCTSYTEMFIKRSRQKAFHWTMR